MPIQWQLCLPGSRQPSTDAVLGYLGCIGSWFDWPLVVELAHQLPQARLELVGPHACFTAKQFAFKYPFISGHANKARHAVICRDFRPDLFPFATMP